MIEQTGEARAEDLRITAYERMGLASRGFVQGMMNALAVGALRYSKGGRRAVNAKDTQDHEPLDYPATIKWRVAQYEATGDRKHLIDAGNFCLIEWVKRATDVEHSPLDSGESSPGNVSTSGVVVRARGEWGHLNGTKVTGGGDVVAARLPGTEALILEILKRQRNVLAILEHRFDDIVTEKEA